jgi:hypothetical protein
LEKFIPWCRCISRNIPIFSHEPTSIFIILLFCVFCVL